ARPGTVAEFAFLFGDRGVRAVVERSRDLPRAPRPSRAGRLHLRDGNSACRAPFVDADGDGRMFARGTAEGGCPVARRRGDAFERELRFGGMDRERARFADAR